jgi:23S rRNA pseudouridine955/2504/2580 synthase
MKEITVTENESNQRLDRFLKKLMPEASAGFLQKMLRKKRIKLNGQKSEPSTKITAGDVIALYFSEETIAQFRASDSAPKVFCTNTVSLDIIYEDDDLLVVNKPAGMLTQPDKTGAAALVDYAVDYLIKKGDYDPAVNLTFTPACANRLDKNTTGIILIPKNYPTLQAVTQAIREDQTQKIYYALVLGKPAATGSIIGYLKKDPDTNTVTFFEQPTSSTDKKSRLNYQTLESHDDYSLLKITLLTGRSHQIRVQLAAMGYPILGDPKYGNRPVNRRLYERLGIKNQLLHSALFSLSPREQTFCAPFPPDFLKALEKLGFHQTKLTEV